MSVSYGQAQSVPGPESLPQNEPKPGLFAGIRIGDALFHFGCFVAALAVIVVSVLLVIVLAM